MMMMISLSPKINFLVNLTRAIWMWDGEDEVNLRSCGGGSSIVVEQTERKIIQS